VRESKAGEFFNQTFYALWREEKGAVGNLSDVFSMIGNRGGEK
jgi:hypothetical protein